MRVTLGRRFLVALTIALIAGLIFRASYFQANSEAYLFPSIIAAVILVLSLMSLARETFNLCVDDFQAFPFSRQLPALVIMALGVWLVELLGMYSSALVVLLSVTYWYSPEENGLRRLIGSLGFAVGFVVFMYLLFTVMLNVQLPRGIFI